MIENEKKLSHQQIKYTKKKKKRKKHLTFLTKKIQRQEQMEA